ncbi:DUF1196 domain-containing protein [Vibrio mimicus]|nr:DUF1196 domain-containing protein [Vibrio mimicus]
MTVPLEAFVMCIFLTSTPNRQRRLGVRKPLFCDSLFP